MTQPLLNMIPMGARIELQNLANRATVEGYTTFSPIKVTFWTMESGVLELPMFKGNKEITVKVIFLPNTYKEQP